MNANDKVNLGKPVLENYTYFEELCKIVLRLEKRISKLEKKNNLPTEKYHGTHVIRDNI